MSKEISMLLVATSAYYREKLDDMTICIYAKELSDIGLDELSKALESIRKDPKVNRFPLPALIRSVARPASNPEGEAMEAAGRIIQAISRMGPYRVADARQFVGELGWSVVQSEGGWENVCSNLTNDNIGVLRSQWVKIALSKIDRAKRGLTDAPALPSDGIKSLGFGEILKQIPKQEWPE